MEHFNFRVERSGASPVLFEFGYDVSRKKFYPRVFDAEMLWKKVFSGEFVNGTLTFDSMRFVPHPSLGPVYSEVDKKFYLSQYGMRIKEIFPTNAENEIIILTAEPRDDFTQVSSLVRPVRNNNGDIDVDKDFFVIDVMVETFSSDRKVLINRNIYQSSIADWKKNIELDILKGGSHAFLISTSRGIRVNIPIKMSSFDASDDPFTLSAIEPSTGEIIEIIQINTNMHFNFFLKEEIENPILTSSFKSSLTPTGNNQLRVLERYIEIASALFKGGTVYAPFTSLIQSSGSGKSKLCVELLKKHPGINLVFRGESQGVSYPPQPQWIHKFTQFVFDARHDELPETDFLNVVARNFSPGRILLAISYFIDIYYTCFGWLQTKGLSREQIIRMIGSKFESKASFWIFSEYEDSTNVLDERSLIARFEQSDNRTFQEVITDILFLTHYHPRNVVIEADFVPTPFVKVSTELINSVLGESSTFPFLIFFDEADIFDRLKKEHRLSGIHVLRRGLHLLHSNSRLFLMALGTNSDALEFAPSIRNDSIRYSKRINMLPPFFLSRNWDIFADQLLLEKQELTEELLLNDNMLKLLFSMGRPLWSSYITENVVDAAVLKLKNGRELSAAALIAALLVRSSLEVSPSHFLTRTLVQSYMAIVSYISYDAHFTRASYSSEPALALGAREIFRNVPKRKLALDALLAFVQGRAIDKGRIVEALFQHIMLFSIDDAKVEKNSVPFKSDTITFNRLAQGLTQSSHLLAIQAPNPTASASASTSTIYSPLGSTSTPATPQQNISSTIDIVSPMRRLSISSRSDIEMRSETTQQSSTSSSSGSSTRLAPPVTTEAPAEIMTSKYRVIRVSDFLISLFGMRKFLEMKRYLSKRTLSAYVNATHFVNLEGRVTDATFAPRSRFSPTESRHANESEAQNTNKSRAFLPTVIDRALLKIGLMRQCAFVMPESYYGIDFIIPLMYPQSECNGNRPQYSFIAIQSKASKSSTYLTDLLKMRARSHLVKCPNFHEICTEDCVQITNEDMDFICGNQLVIYLSMEWGSRQVMDAVLKTAVKDVFSLEHLADHQKPLPPSLKASSLKVNRGGVIKRRLNEPTKKRFLAKFIESAVGHKPEFMNTSDLQKSNFLKYPYTKSDVNNPDLIMKRVLDHQTSISVLNWKRAGNSGYDNMTCITSFDSINFGHLFSEDTIPVLKEVAFRPNSILDGIDDLNGPIAKDATLNGIFSPFHRFNPSLRRARNQAEVPDQLTNLEELYTLETLTALANTQ